MKKLMEQMAEELSAAFEKAGYDPSYGKVTVSNRPDLCEYQCNGAMAGAKAYKKAPFMIADDVVAAIGSIAATEVEGVVSMAGNIGNELASKMGVKSLAKGVKVEVNGKNVKADITLIVKYGYSIPAISQKVQDKVKSTIESMTGLNVTDVNIRVAGVGM